MGKPNKNNTENTVRLTPVSFLEGAKAFTLLLVPQLVLLSQEHWAKGSKWLAVADVLEDPQSPPGSSE